MSTHTQGPLDIFGDGVITLENGTTHEVQVLTVKDQRGNDEEVAYCFDVDRASFIVRACNAHEELLKALVDAQAILGDLVRSGTASIDEIETYSTVKAAIAKAEGRF